MMTSARNTPAFGNKKKPRKPYTISRPREKWSADEHERFLHSLLMFGRDWKTIEQFVGTKTATQIRSHAQKHFIKAHKLGLAAAPPPPHPRRAAVLRQRSATSCSVDDDAAATSLIAPVTRQSMDDWSASCSTSAAGAPRWPDHDDSVMATPNRSVGSPSSEEAWYADGLVQDGTVELPLSPDDLRFAEVYRFVGEIFSSNVPWPWQIETQLKRLHGMDPVVAETILLVLRNLQDNLCA
ncbi:hypothetical protein PR202_gb24772 [Eleusine coracana subsp. coracana]|uniref:Uncharacterized protein n=1 Tax=Eleusine coracana subsp. coracana TaxID=191504 RepID=A0AAV5FJX1_ELECO|nr:hypothetical protein QOZ80_5BG0452140 [Eleusine coracana subsp. coracana]GJN35954.1 hypothetical protein PR202_gb24772 [Eleusine coracana subsp. coracana]